MPQLAHGGGAGWNSSVMTHWLPEFQAGAQPVSLPPAPGAGPLPVIVVYKLRRIVSRLLYSLAKIGHQTALLVNYIIPLI